MLLFNIFRLRLSTLLFFSFTILTVVARPDCRGHHRRTDKSRKQIEAQSGARPARSSRQSERSRNVQDCQFGLFFFPDHLFLLKHLPSRANPTEENHTRWIHPLRPIPQPATLRCRRGLDRRLGRRRRRRRTGSRRGGSDRGREYLQRNQARGWVLSEPISLFIRKPLTTVSFFFRTLEALDVGLCPPRSPFPIDSVQIQRPDRDGQARRELFAPTTAAVVENEANFSYSAGRFGLDSTRRCPYSVQRLVITSGHGRGPRLARMESPEQSPDPNPGRIPTAPGCRTRSARGDCQLGIEFGNNIDRQGRKGSAVWRELDIQRRQCSSGQADGEEWRSIDRSSNGRSPASSSKRHSASEG